MRLDTTVEQGRPSGRGVTLRAVLLAVLLIPLKAYWISVSEIMTGTTEITCTSLFIGVTFILFLLTLLNLLVRRFRPRLALDRGELLVIYVMLSLATAVAGIGVIGFLTPALSNPFYYATDENRWADYQAFLPRWFAPRDPEAIRRFYEGHSTLYLPEHLSAWLIPGFVWGVFLFLLLATTACLCILLRRQWVERERLTFPIVYLPLALAQEAERPSMFRQRLFWIGFIGPVILQTINSLNFLYPWIPSIPVKPTIAGPLDLGPHFVTRPWNALGYFPLAFHPNTIGLAFLLSLDVSFSFWAFYLLRKAADVATVAMGLRDPGAGAALARFPYTSEQGVGAWVGLVLALLWIARRHLHAVWRSVLGGRRSGVDDSDEPFSYRTAFLGFWIGLALLTTFGVKAGMSLAVPLVLFLVYAVYMTAMTRIRGEAGLPWTYGPNFNPNQLVVQLSGSASLGSRDLVMLAGLMWFNLDYRCASMPHQMEAFKIGSAARLRQSRLLGAMALATAVGIVAALWATLQLYYVQGAATAKVNSWRIDMGKIPWQLLRGWLDNPQETDWPLVYASSFGFAVVLFLSWMRTHFLWWPFHPLGYATACTFNPDLLWCPFLVAWLVKSLLLRYGGIKAYRRALPLFLGLILGDYVIASIWTIAGAVLGINMYRCFPN